ncbi:hypothetical protein D3C76_707710 [compost metagenome]
MAHELALMQVFDTGQRITDLLQTLLQHVLAHAHGLAGVAEQAGNFRLMLHHEIRFGEIEHRQCAASVLRRRHQLAFLTGAGITIVRVTDNEDFPCLEALFKRRVEPLQPGDWQRGIVPGQLQQHLCERHAPGNYIEPRLQGTGQRTYHGLGKTFGVDGV